MQETGNNIAAQRVAERLTIRVGQFSLAFAYKKQDGNYAFLPYNIKNGISMAANLREALKDENLNIGTWKKVLVLIDSPVVMVPIDEYNEQNKEVLYNYSITGQDDCAVLATILPSVNAVALYSLNKDLRMVLTDNFTDIKIHPVCASMWRHLQRRSLSGNKEKLYCYFHDSKMEICCFRKNRFRFSNCFCATHTDDAAYFILATWQQLGMNSKTDDIYILGEICEPEKLKEALKKYVGNVYTIKPSADFNRHPLTQVANIPFDMITTLLR